MLNIVEVYPDHGAGRVNEGKGQDRIYYLCVVTYGKCVYWVDNKKLIAGKGELLLMPASIPHQCQSIPTMLHTKSEIYFMVDDDAMRLPILHLQEPLIIKLGCYELVNERCKSLLEQWKERPSYYELMANALLMEILVYVNREQDRGIIASPKHRAVDSMKQYIQRHYREQLTKEDLGEVIKKTPNYAANLFKSVTNQTISEYVHQQRMKRAMYMLTESQLTVGEISEFLGYKDPSYFYRVFKRVVGNTPSEFLQERPSVM